MDPAVRAARVERRAVLGPTESGRRRERGRTTRVDEGLGQESRVGQRPDVDRAVAARGRDAVAGRMPSPTPTHRSFRARRSANPRRRAPARASQTNTRPSPVPASNRCPSGVKATLRKSTPAVNGSPSSVHVSCRRAGRAPSSAAVAEPRRRPARTRPTTAHPTAGRCARPAVTPDSRSQRQTPPAPTATSQRPLGSIAASSMPPSGPDRVRGRRAGRRVPEANRAVACSRHDR